MPNPSRKRLHEPPRPSSQASAVHIAGPQDPAAHSPPGAAKRFLQEMFGHPGERPGGAGRWSQRRTLAFVGLTCGGFWTCVIVGLAHVLRQG